MARPYSASKIASEALIYSYARCYGLRYLVFRFSNVYGRYDNDLSRMVRVIPLFTHRLIRKQPITVYGGSDQFSHAVMAQEVLAHGAYGSYLVYPPGFASLSAVICRFSGLPPLRLYPVLASALLVLTAVAAYALAAKLWGFWPGLAAAFLSGLVLSGSWASFAAGRYPDLTAAYFLLMMAVAALVTLYQQPSVRSVLLVTVLSASVVLYHSVASLYIALVLAAAGLAGLVCLVIARGGGSAQRLQARRLTAALAGALACTAVLAAGYAAYTYLHGNAAGGQSATSTAVNIAVGSQPAYGGATILDTLGAPVVWLGVLGLAALAAGLVRLRRPGQVLTAVTLALCPDMVRTHSPLSPAQSLTVRSAEPVTIWRPSPVPS